MELSAYGLSVERTHTATSTLKKKANDLYLGLIRIEWEQHEDLYVADINTGTSLDSPKISRVYCEFEPGTTKIIKMKHGNKDIINKPKNNEIIVVSGGMSFCPPSVRNKYQKNDLQSSLYRILSHSQS